MLIDNIEEGYFYHIYNRGNNGGDIFFDQENYEYFLKLLAKYIIPVADIYCYCLLKNHFHLLVRIKEIADVRNDELSYKTTKKPLFVNASKQFAHMFNAYAQAINKRYSRTGSLFEKPFERKRITNEDYLRQVILYIHHNPIHHSFSISIENYKWSSYRSILSTSASKIKREEIIQLFESPENFIYCHENYDFINSKF